MTDNTKQSIHKLYYQDKLNFGQIAAVLKLNPTTISRTIKKFGLPLRKTSGFRRAPCKLSRRQEEIITGSLLGDGGLAKTDNDTSSSFYYASKSKEHVLYVTDCLEKLNGRKKGGLDFIQQYDKRTSKTYSRYVFHSVYDTTFLKIRKKWYPAGVKIIPPNTILTPKILLIWYLGDGTLNNQTGNISFATDSFDRKNIEELCGQLKPFLARIIKRGDTVYRILIPRRRVKQFLRYIGPCPVEDYKHKWEHVEYKFLTYSKN